LQQVRLPTEDDPVRLICRAVLPMLPDGCADAVITDPPYPGIVREYGTWTEAEWFDLMDLVVGQCRRILKPTGSAVFILQPNSERVGRMRTWLWEFMAKWGREWGMVQDAWWWNYTAIPEGHSIQGRLMRPSVKACVWLGAPDCYRNQERVLWELSDYTVRQATRAAARFRDNEPSGHGMNRQKCAAGAVERGGSSPYNLLPIANARGHDSAGGHGHGAGTPPALVRWWVRYICPPGGTVVDPFLGSGTTALACLTERGRCLGIERKPEYVSIAQKRLAEPLGVGGLFAPSAPAAAELW
jgi:hypothetical protein